MIFKFSIFLSIIGIIFLLFAQPINWIALICALISLIYSIVFTIMHNDLSYLKELHKEEFKRRDRTDIKTDKD